MHGPNKTQELWSRLLGKKRGDVGRVLVGGRVGAAGHHVTSSRTQPF